MGRLEGDKRPAQDGMSSPMGQFTKVRGMSARRAPERLRLCRNVSYTLAPLLCAQMKVLRRGANAAVYCVGETADGQRLLIKLLKRSQVRGCAAQRPLLCAAPRWYTPASCSAPARGLTTPPRLQVGGSDTTEAEVFHSLRLRHPHILPPQEVGTSPPARRPGPALGRPLPSEAARRPFINRP